MANFGMHEKRKSPWLVVLGIRFCLAEISAVGKSSGLLSCLTGTSTNRFDNPHDLQCSGYLELCSVACTVPCCAAFNGVSLDAAKKYFPERSKTVDVERPQRRTTTHSGSVCVGVAVCRSHFSSPKFLDLSYRSFKSI